MGRNDIVMSEEVLLQLLEAGVVNVGGDDVRLEKLQATAKDLAISLKKAPDATSSWTMAAADPAVDPADPAIQEAWSVLKKHWTTVANTYQSTPVAILRACLLDAIVQSAAQSDNIGVAFVNTARNILPHVESSDEAGVWKTVVGYIQARVDARAEREWATPETIQLGTMNYKAPDKLMIASQKNTTNVDTLSAGILAASGPTGGDNNPHWANDPHSWANEFAPRLAKAIAKSIDGVATANAIAPVDLAPPLSQLADDVGRYVGEALGAFSGATAGLQRRTNLLWWKEALYSPSARVSYRTLPVFPAATLMALDLFEQVPTFSPGSVSAFLEEAIRLLPATKDTEPQAVTDLISELRHSKPLEPLRRTAEHYTGTPSGRGPILALLGHGELATIDAEALRKFTGLPSSVSLSPNDWGALVFRELQAARATAKKPVRKV